MRRRAVLGGALLLAGCGSRVRLDTLAAAGERRVADVLSGDRLRLEDRREVKLAGIQAPAGDAAYAVNARAALDRLAKGRQVQLLSAGSLADAEGRTLAHVRLKGGAWLQEALLREGAARVRPAAGERALAKEMLEVEARARSRRRGLWALDAYRVLLPAELAPWATGLQIVEGRVQRVGATRNLSYIDFTRDWSSVASAEVASRVMRDFATAGVDLRSFEGRLLRLRGDVQRLRIQIAAPESVEVLEG